MLDYEDPYYEAVEEEEQLREFVEEHAPDMIELENMPSHYSYEIMDDFVKQLTNRRLKDKLRTALNGRKPFANFKHLIDHSNFREDWFAFKEQQEYNWTKKQLQRIEQSWEIDQE